MNPLPLRSTTEPLAPEQQVLALARPLAVVIGGGVLAAGGIGWGRGGTIAAAVGVLLSLGNVWFLHRMGTRAMRTAGDSPNDAGQATQAAVGLQVALAAKTVILLALVALLANRGAIARNVTPFALGTLVTVFALLAAGLLAPLATKFGRFRASSQPVSG
jgi:hypothetical protein